jgi:hypothetical protein
MVQIKITLWRLIPLLVFASLPTFLTMSSITRNSNVAMHKAISTYDFKGCQQVTFDWLRRSCQEAIYSHYKNECYLMEKDDRSAEQCMGEISFRPEQFEEQSRDQTLMSLLMLLIQFFYMILIYNLRKLYKRKSGVIFQILDKFGDFLSKFSGK